MFCKRITMAFSVTLSFSSSNAHNTVCLWVKKQRVIKETVCFRNRKVFMAGVWGLGAIPGAGLWGGGAAGRYVRKAGLGWHVCLSDLCACKKQGSR